MDFLKDNYTFADLLEIMKILRGENGCSWDRAQDHQSIKNALMEESMEAMEALDTKTPDDFADELGDVLLQVVFHAQIGAEKNTFTIQDVINHICRKLVSRHTHIFGSDHSENCDTALDIWEQNKKKEKGLTTQTEVLRDVCAYLPALLRSSKVQKKASKVGFDFANTKDALAKVKEEISELEAAIENNDTQNIHEELGDVLFSAVNVSRFVDVDAEKALHNATEKFIRRFAALEDACLKNGKHLESLALAEMDAVWDDIKHQ